MTTDLPKGVRLATVTLSDTRTIEDDASGRLLGELCVEAGFEVVSHEVVREDPGAVRAAIERLLAAPGVDAIVTTGGTGITPRDRTIEAITPLFETTVEGFGEAFRRLSWDEIGPRGMLSRATMGVAAGRVVVALPGSPNAVRLGVTRLIAPMLAHAVGLASGRATKHDHGAKHAHERGGR